jgi:phosphate transport system substrate-binding protein
VKVRTFAHGVIAALVLSLAPAAANIRLSETGSSLFYPLLTAWAEAYHRTDPTVRIDTEATGSGAGVALAGQGRVQIGASDAYLSDEQLKSASLVNVALAVSAQLVAYHLPEIGSAHLNLSGPVLAQIYMGRIAFWDDAQIAALNRDLAARLPHRAIVAVHRTDSAGDTFLFTSYLSATSPEWKAGPGSGTRIAWPRVPRGAEALRNRGMVEVLKLTPYALGYVGISYLDQTVAERLAYAALRNREGRFVLPSDESLEATLHAFAGKVPADQRLSLVDAPGENAYPIVNFEYAVVNAHQRSPAVAQEIQKFLSWTISPDGGSQSSFLGPVHFVALPPEVREESRKQIALIR